MPVDTWPTTLVHRAVRRAFRTAPLWIGTVRAGDRERAEFVGRHLDTVVGGLLAYQSIMDELVPMTRLRALVDQVRELLPGWRITADLVTGRELAALFATASALVDGHLAEVEARVLPLPVDEWRALVDRGRAGIPLSRAGFVVLGELLAEADRLERAAFLAMVPVSVRVLWYVAGRVVYPRTRARLYAGVPEPYPSGAVRL